MVALMSRSRGPGSGGRPVELTEGGGTIRMSRLIEDIVAIAIASGGRLVRGTNGFDHRGGVGGGGNL